MDFFTAIISLLTVLGIVFYYLQKQQEEDYSEQKKSSLSSSADRERSLPEEQHGKNDSSSSSLLDTQCRQFLLAELKLATNDFDDAFVIGKGGFGKVYKGTIDFARGKTDVAIKRLNFDSKQGVIEFQAEIEMLSKFRHSHIVSLLGYHEESDKSEMILVYEYMPNGSLEDHLHKRRANGSNTSLLTWFQRLCISIGAARGLDYLHSGTGVESRVIHRDIKSSNILLDHNLAAKIADFGLSRIGPANLAGTTNVYTDQIKGTFGYMDAEYFTTRRLTRKSDVYAFGVVLLELLCARPAVDHTLNEEQHSLSVWARDCIKEGKIDQIIDPCLKRQTTANCLKEFARIAYECIRTHSKARPTMTKVVAWLESLLALTSQELGRATNAELFTSNIPEMNPSLASILGELGLSSDSDLKVFMAQTVGSELINLLKSDDMHSRKAALKALNHISSCDQSAKILVDQGILLPLVKELFTVQNQVSMRLSEISATILANIVKCNNCDFDSIPVGPNHQTLVSEDILHNLLHLISNTGPATECKLLQVLAGLTNSPLTLISVVSAIKSSGAINSLLQFIEAPQQDVRLAAIKLLQNLSPHMAQELASSLCGTAGQLGDLIKVFSENIEIVGLLADILECDMGLTLTREMLDEGAFEMVISRIRLTRQGEPPRSCFVTSYLEGLVRVLSRLTFLLPYDEPKAVSLCRDHDLVGLLVDLLQLNMLDTVQMVSAFSLEKLSQQSKNLTTYPKIPTKSPKMLFKKKTVVTGLCRVHRGVCSQKDTFCLLEGLALPRLVALLDHTNEKVIEASLAALSTLLDDGVNIEEGVSFLCEAEGIEPILIVLLQKQTESLRKRAVWVVERLLRTEDIAYEVSGYYSNVSIALVQACQHGDYQTRQIAVRALKHIDKSTDNPWSELVVYTK